MLGPTRWAPTVRWSPGLRRAIPASISTTPAPLGSAIQGSFGKLTLNADGSYSYVRDAGTQGGTPDVFTYTLKDGDGDLSHTTLTIAIGNSTPSVNVPAAGGAGALVDEKGLPPHGGLPAGSGESANGNPNDNSDTSETTSGTFTITSPDGIDHITVKATSITLAQLLAASPGSPITIAGDDGTLSLTGYNAGTGAVSYSYTLTTNTTGDATHDDFSIVATDLDGQSSPTVTLQINITDDVPTAVADTDSVAAGQFTAETGNVITAVGTTNAGADTLGADGAVVAGVAAGNTGVDLDSAGTVGTAIQGSFGKLTLNADGSYSYVRDAGTQGGASDVFTYTLKDGDGDLSHTTLTVAIGNSTPSVNVPAAGAAGALVDEKGLPPHGGLPAGSGESANGNPNDNSDTSETTSGTFTITSPDGIDHITVKATSITLAQLLAASPGSPITIAGDDGTLSHHRLQCRHRSGQLQLHADHQHHRRRHPRRLQHRRHRPRRPVLADGDAADQHHRRRSDGGSRHRQRGGGSVHGRDRQCHHGGGDDQCWGRHAGRRRCGGRRGCGGQ